MFVTNQYGELFCKTKDGDEGFITKINIFPITPESAVEIRELDSKDTFIAKAGEVSLKTADDKFVPLIDAFRAQTITIVDLKVRENSAPFEKLVHDRCDRFSYDVRVDESNPCCNFKVHFKNKLFDKVEFNMVSPYKEYQWKAMSKVPELIEHARKEMEGL